jgi:hypothetical protein
MSKEFELIPDASNLIESQRSVGYIFETAVADIIDNSVSAKAKNVELKYRNQSDTHQPYVAIIDDGYGMDDEELLQAMKYGSKSMFDARDKQDLGRFGLGLKMASFSQCRKLTVISKKDGIVSACQWDLDLIAKTQKWTLKIFDASEIDHLLMSYELSDKNSGTVVLWENFDKIEKSNNFNAEFDHLLDKTSDHLSLVFHRYISDKRLFISFNGRTLEAVDPFFTSNTKTQPLEEEALRFNRRVIKVKPYIVPYQSHLNQRERLIIKKYQELGLGQGLYIYRNQRLIAWGKWFRLFKNDELANLAKVRIDIPNDMDDLWGIDVKKSTLDIPAGLREGIKGIIERSVGKSKRVYEHQGNKRNKDNLSHVFDRFEGKDDHVSYRINRDNPLISRLRENASDVDNRLLEALLKQIEDNIPFESVRYDLASKKELDKNEISDDEEYENIMTLLGFDSNPSSKKALLEMLKKLDAYQDKLEVINRIEGEMND